MPSLVSVMVATCVSCILSLCSRSCALPFMPLTLAYSRFILVVICASCFFLCFGFRLLMHLKLTFLLCCLLLLFVVFFRILVFVVVVGRLSGVGVWVSGSFVSESGMWAVNC